MKKSKTIYRILALPLVSILIGGCTKYFDVNPDMRTELNTVDKVGQLLVTAYPTADYLLFTEAASDNTFDRGPGDYALNDLTRQAYLGEEITVQAGDNTPAAYWLAMYKCIGAANQAIEAVDENNFGPKGQQYKGEALIVRAYAHHMLVSLFSKAYQIGGDNSTLGVPYLTVPEKKAFMNYERGTVASVYENIEKDMSEGLRLIKGISLKSPKFHFNEQAAKAFAARFYLFKGDYDKVVQNATAIFPENNFKENLRPVGTAFKTAGSSISALFTASGGNYNLMMAAVGSSFTNQFASGRYGFGKSIQAKMDAINVSGKIFYNYYTYVGGNADKLSLGKYPQFATGGDLFSGSRLYYTLQSLFTVDEALMNRAEAYIHKGPAFYALALKDLNDFAATRIADYNPGTDEITNAKVLAFYNTTDLGEGLMKTLLDFKQNAFLQEGMRWFDLNRLGMDITHNRLNDSHEVLPPLVIKKDDLRRVFQIPESATLSGLPKNPRF
jgi:hypothetical protein